MSYMEQAKKICDKLSSEEKIGQIAYLIPGFSSYQKIDGAFVFSDALKETAQKYGVGAVSAFLRGDPWTKKGYGAGIEIQERLQAVREFQAFITENSAKGIPALIDIEASHGMQSLGSVMYPVGLCSAAAWNPELYGRMLRRIGQEIKASGNHIAFLTLIDLARDPRWGRSEECLGEDGLLASKYIAAGVKGVKSAGVLACAKHFFGAGSADGGSNAAPITASEREIREVLLPPAKAAVDAGCDLVMVAYNALNGEPMHFSHRYLTQVLREELGFEGIILSDGCGIASAVSQTETTPQKAAIQALKAGINMSLEDSGCFITLAESARNDRCLQELIDTSCQRVIAKKLELGLFEKPCPAPDALADFMPNVSGKELAYEMAAEAITLVKNDNGLLPLKQETKLCVLGENGANIYYLLGDYTSDRAPGEGVTIWDGVQAVFPNAVYETGWRFDEENFEESCLETAKSCDVVLLCLGGSSVRHKNVTFLPNGAMEESSTYIDCGEGGDLSGLRLPQSQSRLLAALRKLGKPVVSLFVVGRAYAMVDMIENSDAALICWYPGQEGGRAIADILAGKVNPSGRLPVSLPDNAGCLPVYYNGYAANRKYRDADLGKRVYTFGYGLSYTTFVYSPICAEQVGTSIFVTGSVTNTGPYAGKETVQLFIHKMGGTVRHRKWELFDFEKVSLSSGQTHHYRFEIPLAGLQDVICGEMPDGLKLLLGDQTIQIAIEDLG